MFILTLTSTPLFIGDYSAIALRASPDSLFLTTDSHLAARIEVCRCYEIQWKEESELLWSGYVKVI